MADGKSIPVPPRIKDLTGLRFRFLVVVSFNGIRKRGDNRGTKTYWNCLCDCGKTVVCESSNLEGGNSKSCGCFRFASRNATHGMTNTTIYHIWVGIKARCFNPSNHAYADYGGRGIKVCDRWRDSFEDFLADVGMPPTEKHTLDRYPNNNGNYEPGNVRWATMSQQMRNKRNTIRITYKGRTMALNDWAEELGMSRAMIYHRFVERKLSAEETFETPNRYSSANV